MKRRPCSAARKRGARRRAILTGRQAAGVAVRQHAGAFANQMGAMVADGVALAEIFVGYGLSFPEQGSATEAKSRSAGSSS